MLISWSFKGEANVPYSFYWNECQTCYTFVGRKNISKGNEENTASPKNIKCFHYIYTNFTVII